MSVIKFIDYAAIRKYFDDADYVEELPDNGYKVVQTNPEKITNPDTNETPVKFVTTFRLIDGYYRPVDTHYMNREEADIEDAKTAKIKTDILSVITNFDSGVSFVDLLHGVDGFKGDFKIEVLPNLIMWDGVSGEAMQAFKQLVEEKEIGMGATNPMVYLYDGIVMNFPIAKKLQEYKSPRWLPVVFHKLH